MADKGIRCKLCGESHPGAVHVSYVDIYQPPKARPSVTTPVTKSQNIVTNGQIIVTRRRGRPRLGNKPMTPAERQQKHRGEGVAMSRIWGVTTIRTGTATETATIMSIDIEDGKEVYPCRCGETHRGEYAFHDYMYHNCFHDEPLVDIGGEIGTPMWICPICSKVWATQSCETAFQEEGSP